MFFKCRLRLLFPLFHALSLSVFFLSSLCGHSVCNFFLLYFVYFAGQAVQIDSFNKIIICLFGKVLHKKTI